MKKLLVVGDLHVGSNVSIMPEEVTLPKGNVIEANPTQKKIFSKWEEMVDNVGRVDACITLGDMVDGSDRKGAAKEMWTPDITQQVKTAADLLSMVKTSKYVGVQGSYYHVGDNISSDESVLTQLNGTYANELSVVIDSQRIHVSHDVGVSHSGTAYRTTPIAQQMMLAVLNRDEYGKFGLILRGHTHYYVHVSFGGSQGVIAPCWKGRDSFAARRTLAFMPHMGYVVLNIKDRIEVEPHLFTLKGKDLMKEVVV